MHITWHGNYTVKLQTGDTVVVIDPHPTDGTLPGFKGKATILALSNPHEDAMSYQKGIQDESVLIDSPGEYSIAGTTVTALGWHGADGSERNLQRWVIEKITFLHVGALENRELTDQELQQIEITGIDVLLLPVGGGSGLDTDQALKLLTTIEPRVVIPINYAVGNTAEELATIDKFAKEMSISSENAEKKLILKAHTLPQDELQTVILAA